MVILYSARSAEKFFALPEIVFLINGHSGLPGQATQWAGKKSSLAGMSDTVS
jgi:hypothetical protein